MDWLYGLAICLLVGFACWIFGYLKGSNQEKPFAGTLRIDTSDPDGPYLFLELHTPISEVMRHKQVTMNVSTENYISQK